MKKLYVALMCVATFALFTACGGEKKGTAANGDEPTTDQDATEQTEQAAEPTTDVEKCAATLQAMYGLSLADVQPDFEFAEKLEGYDRFQTNGVNMVRVAYTKKDGSKITNEEWLAYLRKIYDLTATRLSQDGKNVRGYDGMSHLTPEEAAAEKSFDEVAESVIGSWCYLRDDRFQACYPSLNDQGDTNYISVSFAPGLQGNID